MQNVEDLGYLNDTTRPGCIAHTTIACTPDRLCLGVIHNEYIIRKKEDIGNKTSNNLRRIEDKESYKWIKSYKKCLEIAEMCPDTKFVSIGDREADLIELFWEAQMTDYKVDVLVRASHNRSVEIRKEDEVIKTKLNSAVSDSKKLGNISFKIPAQRGKKKRAVQQSIKATSVIIQPPNHKKNKLDPVKINVVLLEEIAPPKGEEAIRWILLTTLPIDSLSDTKEIIKMYLSRWSIEVFFHVLKTGCNIEKLQFENAHNLLNCISIYMIVAWRLYYSVYLGRNCPEVPCTVLFDEDEWQSVYAVVNNAPPPKEPPILGDLIVLIAKLGGFLGRKCDGDPGPRVMWKGLQKMSECAKGWVAFRNFG